MQRRATTTCAVTVLAAIAGYTTPAVLAGQAQATRLSQPAVELGQRSRSRAARWARGAPLFYCAPAPLTERPGASATMARPQVVPLEETFLDAQIVKRTFSRAVPSAGQ